MALNPALVRKQQEQAAANAAPPPPVEANDAAEAPPEPETSALADALSDVPAKVIAPANAGKRATPAKPATPKAASKGPAPLDFKAQFELTFPGGKLSADVLTLTKVIPALGAEMYVLSQGDFQVSADAASLALLLAALPAA